MRILLYNFVQPEEPGAGGVGVYLKNLAVALKHHGQEVILLSSGNRYSAVQKRPRVRFSSNNFERAIVYNSPVIAPALFSVSEPDVYSNSSALDFLPSALAAQYGQIDVFHFQNIEGLTRSFFYELKKEFPHSKLLMSVHNYHSICPRVTLWYQDRTVCEDYRDGLACTVCRDIVLNADDVRRGRRVIGVKAAVKNRLPGMIPLAAFVWRMAKQGRRYLSTRRRKVETAVSFAGQTTPAKASAYEHFRTGNIKMFGIVFDAILAVSDRTKKVIVDRGIPKEKISVSYIGTAHKDVFLHSNKITELGGGLHLGYIGYMTRDKGFHFLLDCLERMPATLASVMSVTIAARKTDVKAFKRMQKVSDKFKNVRYFDGYTHENLDEVLEGVNVGLIPVLWEDNLPQTAIELVSRGIPILTSNRGGAQEIASNPLFTFEAGDHNNLIERLTLIQQREINLGDFWKGQKRIFSMEDHVNDLFQYYAKDSVVQPVVSVA